MELEQLAAKKASLVPQNGSSSRRPVTPNLSGEDEVRVFSTKHRPGSGYDTSDFVRELHQTGSQQGWSSQD